MVIDGFDPVGKSYSATGSIRLIDKQDREAMAWSFVKLIDHWKSKHAQAAFVPAQKRDVLGRQYRFGNKIIIGRGAEFQRLLEALVSGVVYYDPGIKLETDSTGRVRTKRRSQFRVDSRNLGSLYAESRVVDVCDEAAN
jgi:hypothetical protein